MKKYFLYIDTSQQGQIRLAVFGDDKMLAKKTLKVGNQYSEKILTGIDEILKKAGVKLSSRADSDSPSLSEEVERSHNQSKYDETPAPPLKLQAARGRQARGNRSKLKVIFVVKGPGRFSALRTGVTVANVLGWSLNVPVVGITRDVPSVQGVALRQSFDKAQDDIAQGDNSNGVVKYWQNIESLIKQNIKKLESQNKFDRFVIPHYGQEPNTTFSHGS